nr:MAG TPA: hypothetical protein [Caudoviricetes sp.]
MPPLRWYVKGYHAGFFSLLPEKIDEVKNDCYDCIGRVGHIVNPHHDFHGCFLCDLNVLTFHNEPPFCIFITLLGSFSCVVPCMHDVDNKEVLGKTPPNIMIAGFWQICNSGIFTIFFNKPSSKQKTLGIFKKNSGFFFKVALF